MNFLEAFFSDSRKAKSLREPDLANKEDEMPSVGNFHPNPEYVAALFSSGRFLSMSSRVVHIIITRPFQEGSHEEFVTCFCDSSLAADLLFGDPPFIVDRYLRSKFALGKTMLFV
jgi:hypothetical protein